MVEPPAPARRDPESTAQRRLKVDCPQAHGSPRIAFRGSDRVYAVVCSRARGFAVGIDLTPNRCCNFNCCYCESTPENAPRGQTPEPVDASALAAELESILTALNDGRLVVPPGQLPPLAHVAISGHGEPTLCPNFAEAVEAIVHLRAAGKVPFFKLVLLTNATQLDVPRVRAGLRLFTRSDEIWAKLDVGTQAMMDRINRSPVPLTRILQGILTLARRRPVVIQSMFVDLDGERPRAEELFAYVSRLNELKAAGAQISLVQVYSATRRPRDGGCRHLPLRVLCEIADLIRKLTGLPVEVF